jgi:hypothetical protein
MRSFGIGLALLVAGFASYVLSAFLKSMTTVFENMTGFLEQLEGAGAFPAGVTLPENLGTLSIGIPQDLLNILPYLSIGIMAFGVGWFWIIEPMLYLATPPKKRATPQTPPAAPRPREPEAPSLRGKNLEQWVQEAIQEKMDREKGR